MEIFEVHVYDEVCRGEQLRVKRKLQQLRDSIAPGDA